MSSVNYSEDERKDIFDYVNSTHLKLKGEQKKQLKRKFIHTWKQNKTIGCYELFIKLYESFDTYDKTNEWFKQYISDNEETEKDYINRKSVPYAKHRRLIGYRDEEIQELEEQLENIEQSKGFIKRSEHLSTLNDIKTANKYKIDELEDTVIKLRNQLSDKEDYYQSRLKTMSDRVDYWKGEVEKIQASMD
jgi:predicted  nucleic acid-binding Zn-ribbon protein